MRRITKWVTKHIMKRGAAIALGSLVPVVVVGCGGGDAPEACDRSVPGNICTIAGNGENGYAG